MLLCWHGSAIPDGIAAWKLPAIFVASVPPMKYEMQCCEDERGERNVEMLLMEPGNLGSDTTAARKFVNALRSGRVQFDLRPFSLLHCV